MLRLCAFAIALIATPAFAANYTKINDKAEFVKLVQGKTLTRPLVKLEVPLETSRVEARLGM